MENYQKAITELKSLIEKYDNIVFFGGVFLILEVWTVFTISNMIILPKPFSAIPSILVNRMNFIAFTEIKCFFWMPNPMLLILNWHS